MNERTVGEVMGESVNNYAKRKVSVVLETVLYFIVFSLLTIARTGKIGGFSDGLFVSAVASYATVVVVYPIYVITQLIFNPIKTELILSLILSTGVSISGLVSEKLCQNKRVTACFIVSAVCALGGAFFIETTVLGLIRATITLFVAYVGRIGLVSLYEKPKGFRPNATELGCLGVILICIATGFAQINIYDFMPVYALGFMSGAIAVKLLGKGEGIIAGICVGIGCALANFEITAIAFLGFVMVIYTMFSSAHRVLACLSAVMASVVFTLYFNGVYTLAMPMVAMIFAGAVIYCIIPNQFFEKAKKVLFLPDSKTSVRHLIASGRGEDLKKIDKLSRIFDEMAKGLTVVSNDKTDYQAEICERIDRSVCAKCNKCDKSKRWGALCAVSAQIEQKGYASVHEHEYFLEVNCPFVAQIFIQGETVYNEYRHAKKVDNEKRERREDGIKTIRAVSEVLRNFNGQPYPIIYDEKRERVLVEELRYAGIVACDAFIERDELDIITVMVSTDTANGEKIVAVASKIFESAYSLVSVEQADDIYSRVKIIEKTPYDAIFAVSSASKKSCATGDTHAFIKISPTKFITAVCDGMGNGERASKISETAIGLVESFYSAGFNGDFIIDFINRFLSSLAEENFVAFDLFVCDLYTLDSTLVKMGTPHSYVINVDEVSRIEGNALPLGALSEMKPCVYSEKVRDGEMILLVSDGVSDCFEGNTLHSFVATYSGLSPKGLTDAILNETKRRNGGKITDDMTAVAVRVTKRM